MAKIKKMANAWQKKLHNSMNQDFTEQKLPFKEPKLSRPTDDDLTKQWVVDYGVWSFDENRIIRKRRVITGPTVTDRLAFAQAVIDELTKILSTGTAYVGTKPKVHKPKPVADPAKPVEQPISPSFKISRAVEIYIDYTRKAHSPNTFKTYRSGVMALLTYLERHHRLDCTFAQFQLADAVEFLNEIVTVEGNSNRTRNNIKGHVCTFFNHFISLDRSKKLKALGNPFADEDIGKLPQVQNKHQAYSTKQQQQYREICEELGQTYLLTFCRWMYYTLMRPHEELRRLRVRDVRTKLIYVTGNSAKSNEGDYVDIPLPLEQLIQQQKIRDYPGHYFVFSASGEPGVEMVGPKFFYRRHVKVVGKMNLTGSGHDMYSWKHTGAIALWTATKDIELIRHQARHSDIKQTIEYLRDLGLRLADDDKIHKFPIW